MRSQGTVILEIIGVAWGLFALFGLGLLLSSWLKRREQRRHKGHRRRHREWD